MIIKEITCDICKKFNKEWKPGVGWEGWGQINGVELNGIENPNLCPECLDDVMKYVDKKVK